MEKKSSEIIESLKRLLDAKKDVYLTVRVVPKSPRTEVADRMDDGSYKIRVAAPPEGGRANAELVRFLKKTLGAMDARIISGHSERMKLIHLKTA